MRNMMMAAYTGYKTKDKVENFVESFLKFKKANDHLVIISDENESEIDDYLKERQVETIKLPVYTGHPYNDRFLWFEQAAAAWHDDALVMACDIRDVVFQANPFDELQKRLKYDMIYVSENIDFREWWNGHMMKAAFPENMEKMLMRPVYNCGVMMGKARTFCKLMKMMNSTLQYSNEDGLVVDGKECMVIGDQAAYSLLINYEWPKTHGTVTSNIDDFVFTAAVAPYDIERIIIQDGKVCNDKGQPYTIVHQYDRLKEILNYEDGVFTLGPDKVTEGFLNTKVEGQEETRFFHKEA